VDGLEELVVESLVLVLLGLHRHSELPLEVRILATHQLLDLGRLLDSLRSQPQFLPVVAVVLPAGSHILVLLVGPVVLEQRPHH
jgi:hypothetical protein